MNRFFDTKNEDLGRAFSHEYEKARKNLPWWQKVLFRGILGLIREIIEEVIKRSLKAP